VRRIPTLSLFLLVVAGNLAYAQNTTTRVSVATDGAQANSGSNQPAVSADGRFVAFDSHATNLVPGDTNGQQDIFVHDRQTGTTERVNLGANGVQALNGPSEQPWISANGRFVAFTSGATNLVPGDSNARRDVFVRDRQFGVTSRVTVSTGGTESNEQSRCAGITPDGRYVIFSSYGSNLVVGDTNMLEDAFRHDLLTGTTILISLSSGTPGVQANAAAAATSISADGRFVTFTSDAYNLVFGDKNGMTDVFVRDVAANTTTRVSIGPESVQGNGDSYDGDLSDDGRFVVFASFATNLEQGGRPGIFIHDRQTGLTTPLAVSSGPAYVFVLPSAARISGNGRYICFREKLASSPKTEIFLIDRQTLTRSRATVSTNGTAGYSDNSRCDINADGTIVALWSEAANLVANDSNGQPDIFVRTMFPMMAPDRTTFSFSAVTSGGTFVSQTAAQTVRLTQTGIDSVAWSVASNQPWLQVTPASGVGSGTLQISVTPAAGLPPSGKVTGTIFVSLTGAANTIAPLDVTLTLVGTGTSLGPFGTVDTPTDFRTGVTGAVPFTGWALDDVEVVRVSICRDAFGAETAPIDPNCGGAAGIFVGFAVFIDGARPDVLAAFPASPLATRAGWGFMVLTNFLPNQGNGTFRFTMRAQDREGNWSVLGTRTMTCANASATLPFGTLDTPFQGGVASGASFINFGWALTPLPKTIPVDGSTIRVLVDGVDVGKADYNHARPDIQALFPGFNNTNGAVGFRILDTTALANGLHTISWAVTDNMGAIEGIGSRFFSVSNGGGAVTAASTAAAPADLDDVPIDATPLAGRRGWDLEAPYGSFGAGASGVTVVRSEEVNRVELRLGAGDVAGYLRTASGLTPLPIGSRLDPATNVFTWAPGVGFVGPYNFVFVRSRNGRAVSRREVRIILHPKGRGAVGPQVVIDVPRANAAVSSPFMIGGWAVDLDAPEGTGVTTLHAWAFPSTGGAPIFLGATAYGGARPDVAAIHGDRFKESGFGLIAQSLPPGDYDLALFAWSTEQMSFVAPATVGVNVRP
jgi:Tol biopolymer transport system component